ncbi:MAG: iron uptake porin [Prochlorotrichaceae cyanobacterium]|jgi:hypothetical protein
MISNSYLYFSLALLGLQLGASTPAIGAEDLIDNTSADRLSTAFQGQDPFNFSGESEETIALENLFTENPITTLTDLTEAPQSDSQPKLLAQDTLVQSTPVSQLQDIDARHWAAQALRQLSQQYQCLPSYFSEDAVISRYEFAEVLNTCLGVINQAIADVTANNVTQEELAVVQRLQEEFQAELAELNQRVDSLEDQISVLEDQQFVKRTTLFGIAEFVLLDTFGDSFNSPPGRGTGGTIPNANTTFTTGNILLDVDTKVRGRDFVRVELFYSNLPNNNRANTGTDMTWVDAIPASTDFSLNYLFYQTRYAKKGVLRVGPVGLVANHIIPDLSPTQANSRFGRRSPIYRPAVGAGFLTNYQVNDWFAVGGGYTVGGTDAEVPEEGFFSAQNRFIAQTTFTPTPKLGLALTYSHLYLDDPAPPITITGFVGSRNAQAPFGDATATSAHLLGIQGNYRINKRFGFGGWVNYGHATAEETTTIRGLPPGSNVVNNGDTADVWNWALGMTVADVFRKGNELGFLFGMPPKAVSNDFKPFEDNDSTSYHVEAYYRHRVTPRFFITPGIYAVFNPEHNDANNTLVVGLIRSFMRF